MVSQFHRGSTIFTPLVDIIGLPVDQLNFIICSILSIGLGQIMRHRFSPDKYSSYIRGMIESAFGLMILVFCFGDQVKYLFFQSTIAYLILLIFPPRLAAYLVTFWSMGFLAVLHLYRMHYDYGGYTVDITGPVMIQTQKLTCLGFNLLDGYRIKNGMRLSDEKHRATAVNELPDAIRYFSYTLYYHGALAGPFTFYTDYIFYLEGYDNKVLPPAKKQMSTAILFSLVHGLLTAYVAPQFPYIFVCSIDYQRMHMFRRIMFTMISFFLVRQRYYFAWSMSEAAALSAGMGFSGKNEKGVNDWSKSKNYDFFAIESGSSLKVIVDGWNISTTRWLRNLVYERAPSFCKTMSVFMTSAFWHGFYPGYYLMFSSFALMTFCARNVRKQIRPLFLISPITAQFYDILTKIFGNLALNYGQGPFYLLELQSALLFWKPYYFFGHLLSIFVVATLHFRPVLINNERGVQMNFKLGKKAQMQFNKLRDQLQRTLS